MAVTDQLGTAESTPGNIVLGAGASGTLAARVTQLVALLILSRAPQVPTQSACTGGGTVASSSDPAAGSSIVSATAPIIYGELQTDSGVKRYGLGDVGTGASFIEGRMLTLTPTRRGFTDMFGNWLTSSGSALLMDHDGTLRALKSSGELRNKRFDLYAIDLTDLRTGGTPWRLNQFVVREFYARQGREFEIKFEDYFGSSVSEFALGKLIPQRLFSATDFPNINNPFAAENSPGNPTLVGKPVPIGYGSLSDESSGVDAVGVVPVQFVGQRILGGGGPADTWDEYVAFGHAIPRIQSWFAAGEHDLTKREKHTPSSEGVVFLIPGYPAWQTYFGTDMYRDFNGRRYTVIYGRGPQSLLAREGKIPISLNCCGIEATGDGTGTMISSLPLQAQHLLHNFVLLNYATGNWPAIPTVNSYSRIKSSTFAACKTTSEARLGGGYLGAFILGADGTQQSVRELIRDICLSCDIRLGVNRHGQIVASMQNPAAASVLSLTDVNDIIAGGFEPNIRFQETYNRTTYRYARRYIQVPTELTPPENDFLPVANREPQTDWLSGEQEQSDGTSVTNLGETKTHDFSMPMVRDSATADDVAEHVLERVLLPVYTPVVTDFRAAAVELGDNIETSHFEGFDQDMTLEVQEIEIDPNAKQMTVRLTCQDVSHL